MPDPEKRAHPRVPLVAKVDVVGEGHSFLAVTQDISAGGMRIATANPPPVGTSLEITFILPGPERKLRVHAVVRHVIEGSAMGVQFTDLPPDDQAALRTFAKNQ